MRRTSSKNAGPGPARRSWRGTSSTNRPARSGIKQLLHLVGDDVWPKLNEQQQLQRIDARVEFIEYGKATDKLEPFGKAFDVDGFGAAHLTPDIIFASFSEVIEGRREERSRQHASYGSNGWFSLDHTKTAGEKLRDRWLITATSDQGFILLADPVRTTSYGDKITAARIRALAERPNFDVKVVVIDNVPTSGQGEAITNLLEAAKAE